MQGCHGTVVRPTQQGNLLSSADARTALSAPVHSAIRTAAGNLSAAIFFALDMEQPVPQHTHGSLAQSLRTMSDVLREVSEELMNAERNAATSSAQGSEADDQHMAQADQQM